MDNMKSFLDGFEKLAYDILIWLILVPKTLARVITHPSWIAGYVTKELSEKDTARFDDYLSPVILMLLTSLVPFAIMDSFPERGLGVVGPIYGTVGEQSDFKATADFIYPAPSEGKYSFSIDVEAQDASKHNKWDVFPESGVANTDDPESWFAIDWQEEGTYTVVISAENSQGETHIASHNIVIESEGTPIDESPMTFDERETVEGGIKGIQEKLQSETSILAALIFMGLPLVFALSIEMFRGYSITSSVLKRTFYTQCYFFAPLYLSIWSFILFVGFYWVDSINDSLMFLLLLVLTIICIWFIINQVRLIKHERAIGLFKATVIFGFAIFISLTAFTISFIPESIFIVWWGYLIAAFYVFASVFFRRKTDKNSSETNKEDTNV
jgi:hypothetical protein